MEYRLPKEKHDSTICQEIGVAAGQTDGGWSIGHRNEGDDVVLTLPDGVIAPQRIDAGLAAHVALPSTDGMPDPVLVAIRNVLDKPDAGVTDAELKATVLAALRRLIG